MQEIPHSVIVKHIANVSWKQLEARKLLAIYKIIFDRDVTVLKHKV